MKDIRKAIVVVKKLKKFAEEKIKKEGDKEEKEWWKEQKEIYETCLAALNLAKGVEEFTRWDG